MPGGLGGSKGATPGKQRLRGDKRVHKHKLDVHVWGMEGGWHSTLHGGPSCTQCDARPSTRPFPPKSMHFSGHALNFHKCTSWEAKHCKCSAGGLVVSKCLRVHLVDLRSSAKHMRRCDSTQPVKEGDCGTHCSVVLHVCQKDGSFGHVVHV